jgi:hypothetical protein
MTLQEEITGSEELETCRFIFADVAELESSGEASMLEYRTTFCGYA